MISSTSRTSRVTTYWRHTACRHSCSAWCRQVRQGSAQSFQQLNEWMGQEVVMFDEYKVARMAVNGTTAST
jgi:hypothetical protein